MAVPQTKSLPLTGDKINLDQVLTNKEFDKKLNMPRFNSKAPTRIISVSLSKGGVGKTTTAAHLAHGLSLQNRKVLLVDTDRQNQCSLILGCSPVFGTSEFTNPRESDRFQFKDVVHIDDSRPLLHFLAGSDSLDAWEDIASDVARNDMLNPFRKFEFIREAFKSIEKNYDYIIFDTPPKIGVIGYNVLFYARELLIPVFLSAMTEDSVKKFLESYSKIVQMQERLNEKPLKLKYFLPTFEDSTRASRSSYAALENTVKIIKQQGAKTSYLKDVKLLSPIPQTTRIKELPSFGQTIFESSPASAGAQAYGILIEEIIKDEKK